MGGSLTTRTEFGSSRNLRNSAAEVASSLRPIVPSDVTHDRGNLGKFVMITKVVGPSLWAS